jgi:hypothetical protein
LLARPDPRVLKIALGPPILPEPTAEHGEVEPMEALRDEIFLRMALVVCFLAAIVAVADVLRPGLIP